jgi:hypothetical protein
MFALVEREHSALSRPDPSFTSDDEHRELQPFAPAGGGWTYQPLPLFGPEGVSVAWCALDFDEWITNQQHGQLIGFIGNAALDLNVKPRAIAQNDPGLFAIGAGPQALSGRAGKLWLGINDGYDTGTNDNDGSVTVNVRRHFFRSGPCTGTGHAPPVRQHRRRTGTRALAAEQATAPAAVGRVVPRLRRGGRE